MTMKMKTKLRIQQEHWHVTAAAKHRKAQRNAKQRNATEQNDYKVLHTGKNLNEQKQVKLSNKTKKRKENKWKKKKTEPNQRKAEAKGKSVAKT